MSGRLGRLTPDQEAQLAVVRDEWRLTGLATGPADRLRAERGMRMAYAAAGLPPPGLFLWVRSPLEGVLGGAHLALAGADPASRPGRLAAALREAYQEMVGRPGEEPWGRVWAVPSRPPDDVLGTYLSRTTLDSRGVRDHVARRLPRSVGRAARRVVDLDVVEHVRAATQAGVRWHVLHRVWAPAVAEIQTRAWDGLRAIVERDHAGTWAPLRAWSVVRDLYRLVVIQDALHAPARDRSTPDWLAAYDFLGRVCGVDAVDGLRGLMELTRAAGWWWWPQGAAVVLGDRPERLHLDDQGRLHHAREPALVYPDGWSIWAWHGVRVPRRVIESPETLAPAEILAEPDVEVRRIMVERAGPVRLIREGGARRLAEDETGVLWRLDLPDDEPLVCVEVTDASPAPDATYRRYMLRVPPDVRTPREAVAWTFGMEPEEYGPAIET